MVEQLLFEERIREASALLRSIGVENLCLPADLSCDECLIPVCDARRLVKSTLEAEAEFYTVNVIGCILSVSAVAVIAGLFLGYLTLDTLDLQIIERSAIDEDERIYAGAVLPICRKRHLVLVTLLLLNALAYESLPIFLDALVPTWVAILLSTTIIMIFGEIIPSGIFMGPNQLYLAYHMIPLMSFFLWIMWPVAHPLAKLLDYLTDEGDDYDETYNRGELSALIRIQHEERNPVRPTRLRRVIGTTKKHKKVDSTWSELKAEMMEAVDDMKDENDSDEEAPQIEQLMPPLHKREVDLLEGALKMKTVLAMDVYTPIAHVYSVPLNLVLDQESITSIYGHGYSRVPVYVPNMDDPDDKTSISGFLMTRQLMVIDWDDEREISTLPIQRPVCVSARMNLVDLFDVLQKGGPLMTFVCARPDLANKAFEAEKPIPVEAGLLGIVTLVDIMESILQDRIYDEGDIRDRDRAVATLTRWAATKLQSFVLKAYRKKQRQGSFSSVTSTASTSPDKGSITGGENTPLLMNDDDEVLSSYTD